MPLKFSDQCIANRRILGQRGEQAVAKHLTQNGYVLLATNYHKRSGEIDLIVQKKKIISFVEVKLRTKSYFNISEVITPSKQRKIIVTAQQFILERRLFEYVYRFDVALIEYSKNNPIITYIENAFTQE